MLVVSYNGAVGDEGSCCGAATVSSLWFPNSVTSCLSILCLDSFTEMKRGDDESCNDRGVAFQSRCLCGRLIGRWKLQGADRGVGEREERER